MNPPLFAPAPRDFLPWAEIEAMDDGLFEEALPARSSTNARICGCFITKEGHAEPSTAQASLAVEEPPEPLPLAHSPYHTISLNPVSKNEALVMLHRCAAETGQLVLRTSNHLVDVWFAGVGDPENLFVEFLERGGASPGNQPRHRICSLRQAGDLLEQIFLGIGDPETLSAAAAFEAVSQSGRELFEPRSKDEPVAVH